MPPGTGGRPRRCGCRRHRPWRRAARSLPRSGQQDGEQRFPTRLDIWSCTSNTPVNGSSKLPLQAALPWDARSRRAVTRSWSPLRCSEPSTIQATWSSRAAAAGPARCRRSAAPSRSSERPVRGRSKGVRRRCLPCRLRTARHAGGLQRLERENGQRRRNDARLAPLSAPRPPGDAADGRRSRPASLHATSAVDAARRARHRAKERRPEGDARHGGAPPRRQLSPIAAERARGARVSARRHRRDEPEAAPRHGLDEAAALTVVAESAAQARDNLVEVVLLDHRGSAGARRMSAVAVSSSSPAWSTKSSRAPNRRGVKASGLPSR